MGLYRVGQLNKKITIEVSSETQDELGQPVFTWTTHIECFAATRPLKARERFRADRYVYEDYQFFVIRWVAGVTQTMRISYDDGNGARYFNIRNIAELDEGRHRWLELTGEAQA